MEESPPEYLNLRDVDRRRNVVEFRFNVRFTFRDALLLTVAFIGRRIYCVQ